MYSDLILGSCASPHLPLSPIESRKSDPHVYCLRSLSMTYAVLIVELARDYSEDHGILFCLGLLLPVWQTWLPQGTADN